ncbi:MAG: SpoIIE family protein phosphatase [Lachnospiraceae bacterium]|nr:SpoIIE family protein phosphatase [Lachnospiraceae bacterium]MCD7766258.1 SpoIIE family protein phosphatase [Lachnospiraceae bacterium]
MSEWVQPEQEQMEQAAEAFFSLAKLFEKLPCQKERLGDEELQVLFENVRNRACSGCRGESGCWGGAYFEHCRMLYELLKEMEQSGEFSAELRRLLQKKCERPGQLELALLTGYEEARTNLLWSNRMLEQRQAAGEQIARTAELLKRTAEGFTSLPQSEERIAGRLKRELWFLHVEVDAVRAFRQEADRQEYYLTLHIKRHYEKGSIVSARSVAEALSDCCQERMCPAFNCRPAVTAEPMLFHFVPDTKYQFFCGVSHITKAGELVSGDNYTLLQKDTGKVVMSLADGMGSGTAANLESEKVIELLEQFLAAGFPQESAVRLLNSGMLLQNNSPVFSTIDLCMVDLYNARCDMMKSGAAPSFIRKDGQIEVIRANSFPTGVLQQSNYESMHRQLEPGDNIIMMTDGVLDAMPGEDREQAMAELIVRLVTRNAQEYARRLMERVYLMQELNARDDMTILVGTIWEK